jgi:hypothetical protein
MRTFTVLSLPLQLAFLVLSHPQVESRGTVKLTVSYLAKQVFEAFHGERFVQKTFFVNKITQLSQY